MMKENVMMAYKEMDEVVLFLQHSDEDSQIVINGHMYRLSKALKLIEEEPDYEYYAKSLQRHIENYQAAKIEKDYIIQYASKLCELIEVKNKPDKSEEVKAMYEDAKAVCEDIATTVQLGFQATRETIKAEGPQYAAKAMDSIKGVSSKIKSGVRNWLNEDDGEE